MYINCIIVSNLITSVIMYATYKTRSCEQTKHLKSSASTAHFESHLMSIGFVNKFV
ncbi:MAG: hypothetical protein ACTS6G_00365 [Candidatus Hodgkinia cicadicola]